MNILVCSGNGFLSKKIKMVNKLTGVEGIAQEMTHSALRLASSPRSNVFESTTLNKWCGKTGVQLNPYAKWLDNYNGHVWERTLDFKPDAEQCADFISDNLSKPYENGIPGIWELLMCGLRINPKSNLANLHCTELIVAFLQYLGVMKTTMDGEPVLPNNFPPHTFWEGGDVERFLLCNIGKCKELK